jgi:hypothetical protein
VRVHDFLDKDLGKAIPYGVYDIGLNAAWVSVGVDHDTARIRRRAHRPLVAKHGQEGAYAKATGLLITADGGGSNGYRSRLWKVELQGLADRTGLTIGVSHFPPGTSKWNKIEHRLFCHITENCRPGKPPSGRKRGGQPGHKGSRRQMLAPTKPPVDCYPSPAGSLGAAGTSRNSAFSPGTGRTSPVHRHPVVTADEDQKLSRNHHKAPVGY